MRRILVLAGILGVAGAAAAANAAEVSRAVRDVTTIQNESGAGRILFRADLPEDLGAIAVRRAILTVPVTAASAGGEGDRTPRQVDLRVYPVTRPWSAGSADWATGWSRPGGDYDADVYGHADADVLAGGEARFDVTVVVKEILEHGVEAHGFLLTVAPDAGEGIGAADRAALEGFAGATLEVQYRELPPAGGDVCMGPSRRTTRCPDAHSNVHAFAGFTTLASGPCSGGPICGIDYVDPLSWGRVKAYFESTR
jgi:hypothetical protein